MMKRSSIKVAVAVGGLALSSLAGAAVASAQPDLGPAVNSTCTYNQWVAALHAQNPGPASAFDSQPQSQQVMQQFFAAPPAERQRLANVFVSMPGADQNIPVIAQAFNGCKDF